MTNAAFQETPPRDPLASIASRVDRLESAYHRAAATCFLIWKRGVTSEATLAGDRSGETVSRLKSARFDLRVRRLRQAFDRACRVEFDRSLQLIHAEPA